MCTGREVGVSTLLCAGRLLGERSSASTLLHFLIVFTSFSLDFPLFCLYLFIYSFVRLFIDVFDKFIIDHVTP